MTLINYIVNIYIYLIDKIEELKIEAIIFLHRYAGIDE